MLKNIPNILSPELLKILAEMGHGDELSIVDGNFPANSHADKVVRLDGHGIPEILDAILTFMPLDPYVENPTILMNTVANDPIPEIWDVYREIGKKHEKDGLREVGIDKPEYYPRAKNAYATVTTSEKALYANIIIKKGVI